MLTARDGSAAPAGPASRRDRAVVPTGLIPTLLRARFALLALLVLPSTPALLQAAAAPAARHVLVKVRPGPEGAALAAVPDPSLPDGARIVERLPLPGWRRVELGPGMDTDAGVRWFRRRPEVLVAEPNRRYNLHAVPDDPHRRLLYGLDQIGAPAAWSSATGTSQVVVAVVDTGLDPTHPDLAPNLWRNPGEIPANGRDDDANGWVDDVHGVDVLDGDGDPTDDAGHGTHVAGILGAAGNNGRGVTGVCWEVRILAVRVGSADGFGTTAEIVRGFDYLVRLRRRGVNVRVANCSWGGDFPSAALKEAIEAAGAAGILVVCSAGNDGQDNDDLPKFPAGYDVPEVLVVAASTSCDLPWSASNTGRQTVDLAAPGSGIFSTYPRGERYALLSGTSMAAPHVAGAAALVLARRPDLTVGDLRSLLLATADPRPEWDGRTVSGGRLNVARAVERAGLPGPVPAPPAVPLPPAGRVSLASPAPAGRWGNGPSDDPALSADGRWVAFRSAATNLVAGDVEGFDDVFLLDRETRALVRVSQTPAGTGGNGPSGTPAISADGRFVAFVTLASNLGAYDSNAAADIFVWDRTTRQLELVSVRSDGRAAGNLRSDRPALSGDGNLVAFVSEARDLVAADRNLATDVFVRDRARRVTERVSVATGGREAQGWSDSPSLSADGRWVAFDSEAPNLVEGDSNDAWDVFVRDRVEGTTRRASVRADGGEANAEGGYPAISADGRWIAFSSLASNLDDLPGPGVLGLFLKDLVTGTLTRVSAPPGGRAQTGDSFADGLSADGRWVTFTTDDAGLVPGAAPGVYRVLGYDRATGRIEEVVRSESGRTSEDGAILGRTSADGRFVAVASFGFNLMPGDGNGLSDVFVIDRGRDRPDLSIRWEDDSEPAGVGVRHPRVSQRATSTLPAGGEAGYRIELVNAGDARAFRLRLDRAAAPGWVARVTSADGTRDLTGSLLGTGWETPVLPPGSNLWLRLAVRRTDAVGEPVFAVRCSAAGTEAGAAEADAVNAVTRTPLPPPGYRLASRSFDGTPAARNAAPGRISGTGNRVAFSSEADHLVSGADTNYVSDVFVADLDSGRVRRASDGPSGQANGDSLYPSLSADGRWVAFQSRADNLVPGDSNGVEDLFVRDLNTGNLRRANVTAAGVQADHASEGAVLAAGGRWLVFNSLAGTFAAGDTNRAQDVYLKDLDTGALEWISRPAAGGAGDADSQGASVSGDGRFVAFVSLAGNLVPGDGNGVADVFLLDRSRGQLELLSRAAQGGAANGPSGGVSISDDGRWAAFYSYATDLGPGGLEGESRAWLLDRETGLRTPVADLVGSLPHGLEPRRAQISPDGRWLALAATPRCGEPGAGQVLVHDRATGKTVLVSALRTGNPGDAPSVPGGFSAPGRHLLFSSPADNLRGESAYPAEQVYVADLARPAVEAWVRREPDGPWRDPVPPETTLPTLTQVSAPGSIVNPTALARFEVKVRNPADHPDRVIVRVSVGEGAAAGAVWVEASTEPPEDITAEATAAGWRSPELAPGGSLDLQFRVRRPPGADGTGNLLVEWSAASVSDPARRQGSRFVVAADTDDDGIPDAWETRWFGGLARTGADTDADGDGCSDPLEWESGTVPNDAASGAWVETPAPGRVTWTGMPDRYYTLERSGRAEGPFAPAPGFPVPGTGGPMEWTDPGTAGTPSAFYRLRVERP